jgi:hypothetical protein
LGKNLRECEVKGSRLKLCRKMFSLTPKISSRTPGDARTPRLRTRSREITAVSPSLDEDLVGRISDSHLRNTRKATKKLFFEGHARKVVYFFNAL